MGSLILIAGVVWLMMSAGKKDDTNGNGGTNGGDTNGNGGGGGDGPPKRAEHHGITYDLPASTPMKMGVLYMTGSSVLDRSVFSAAASNRGVEAVGVTPAWLQDATYDEWFIPLGEDGQPLPGAAKLVLAVRGAGLKATIFELGQYRDVHPTNAMEKLIEDSVGRAKSVSQAMA